MNKWLDRFLLRTRADYSFTIRDNYEPVTLVYESEVIDEMPILRANWVEEQANYQAYWTQCEIQQRNERFVKWSNVYTSL